MTKKKRASFPATPFWSYHRSDRNTLVVNGVDTCWDMTGTAPEQDAAYAETYVLDCAFAGPS